MRVYKLLFTYTLLLLCTLFTSFTQAGESMLTKKPFFTLRIETKNTHYLAKINGVIIFNDFKNGYMLNSEIPVNYYMKTGGNKISLEILPAYEDKFSSANITLSLYVNQDEAPESEKKLLSSITFNGRDYDKDTGIELSMPAMKLDSNNHFKQSNQGDVILYAAKIGPAAITNTALTISQTIDLQTPFPKWGFLTGDDINFPLTYADYLNDKQKWRDKTINPLYDEYQKIYDLLSANKLDEVMVLFKERNREYDIAMYYPIGTYDKKLRKSFEADLSKYTLKIRSPKNGRPYISDDKKLLKLGRSGLIHFVNDDETSFTNYEILFYKKNGKWIIAR